MTERMYRILFFSFCVALVIFVWLIATFPMGFEGPVTIHRILNYLQKWQTVYAGILAVGAAIIAYKAAMAKVNFDRQQAIKNDAQAKLGIQIKLRFAIANLIDNLQNVRKFLNPGISGRSIQPYQIEVKSWPEFEEAWAQLDRLPIQVIYFLDRVERRFRALRL